MSNEKVWFQEMDMWCCRMSCLNVGTGGITSHHRRQNKVRRNQHEYHQRQYPSNKSFEHESSFLSFHPVRHVESILLLLYRYRPRKDSIRKFQEFHFYVLYQQKVLEVSEGLGNIASDGECEEVLVLSMPMDNKC